MIDDRQQKAEQIPNYNTFTFSGQKYHIEVSERVEGMIIYGLSVDTWDGEVHVMSLALGKGSARFSDDQLNARFRDALDVIDKDYKRSSQHFKLSAPQEIVLLFQRALDPKDLQSKIAPEARFSTPGYGLS